MLEKQTKAPTPIGSNGGGSAQNGWQTPIQQKPYHDTGLIKVAAKSKSVAATHKITDKDILDLWPVLEQYYNLWISYPDKFIEMITPPTSGFKLEDIQQLVLRIFFRYELVFLTATRGFSKTFVGVLGSILKAIFIPNYQNFICAESLKQANAIAQQKIAEWYRLLPLLKNEVKTGRGAKTTERKDDIVVEYKGGSTLDLIAPIPSYRGLRRHEGHFEEAIMLDAEATNEIVVPIVNISHRMPDGTINPSQPQAVQRYVTSASTKNNFAYEKAIEVLIASVIDPKRAISIGFDWEVPVAYGMVDKRKIRNMKASPTYDTGSFAREMCSRWTGSNANAWIDFSKMDKYRTIDRCEFKPYYRSDRETMYYLSVDVGRARDRSVFSIFKVWATGQGDRAHWKKQLVNIDVLEKASLQGQCLRIKRLDAIFGFKKIVVDANGIGQGLVDALCEHSIDPETNETLLGYNVLNRDQHTQYKDSFSADKLTKLWALFTNQHSAGLDNSWPEYSFSVYQRGRRSLCVC